MRRKLISFLLATAALTAITTTLASAGSVYVPIEPASVDDQTFVSIGNPTGTTVVLTHYLIKPFTDGIEDRPDPLPTIEIPPYGTVVLRESLPAGQRGILEISSASALPVSARLGKVGDTPSTLVGASVPVIYAGNVAARNEHQYLAAMQRNSEESVMTNFRMVNLGNVEANCEVAVHLLDGTELGGPYVFPGRKPLSVTTFDDALAALGPGVFSDLRARVTCDQPFFSYFVTYNDETQLSSFTGPAAEVSSGLSPGPRTLCTPGAYCFEHQGVFHIPTSSNRVERLAFPTPPGTYNRVHVTLEVVIGGWQTPQSGLHNVFWLALQRNRNLMGYVNLRGPNLNQTLFRHGFGQPQEDKAKVTIPTLVVPGQTYTFEYIYDTNIDLIDLRITDSTGQEVGRILHSPDTNKITVTDNEIILMDFGFLGINPNEPATIGWQYQNLFMEIQP